MRHQCGAIQQHAHETSATTSAANHAGRRRRSKGLLSSEREWMSARAATRRRQANRLLRKGSGSASNDAQIERDLGDAHARGVNASALELRHGQRRRQGPTAMANNRL